MSARDKRQQAEADHRRAAHRDKWRAAHAARAGWTGEDRAAEAEALQAQIQSMVESGAVTVCPPDIALASRTTGHPDTARLISGWVTTPTQ
ncbi:hypothetical protein SAMN04488103_102436 [Gemmobacter aquatilis]|uniref:Uncharacterized protein n=1 Tax=Gemmobacter aquatilis TaxID=933059 RepID=A0A1H8C8Z0_9RHOB|nr:hypothetical protein [Gemmobacter aquatilis]SEM91681.1 hypothetical protein SAMN04488103_102436 [Gemmobacter aquatilis]